MSVAIKIATNSAWQMVPFEEAVTDATSGNPKIPQNEYLSAGELPIIDQGQQEIGGYVDDVNLKCKEALPCIVFGDHTKSIKFINYDFALGADGVKVLVPKRNDIDKKYLYRFLQTIKLPDDAGYSRHYKFLKRAVVPVPPLEEQKRIAEILDKADAIRRKRAESLKLLDELLRATFLDMFGDPITNPKNLKKKPLKDFGTVVTGNTPSRADAENYGDYIEWIKSDNLNNPQHYLTKATEGLSEKGARKSRLLPSGSILVTCIAGSPSCIGNAGIADREVAFNQQINAVTPFPHVDMYFLYTQILVAKKLIQSASTNAMKGMINKSKFENIRLLDADENTQKKAGKIFLKIIHEHSVFSNSTTESDTLFHSLVARAFKGEL